MKSFPKASVTSLRMRRNKWSKWRFWCKTYCLEKVSNLTFLLSGWNGHWWSSILLHKRSDRKSSFFSNATWLHVSHPGWHVWDAWLVLLGVHAVDWHVSFVNVGSWCTRRPDLKHGSNPTQRDVLRPTKMHLQLLKGSRSWCRLKDVAFRPFSQLQYALFRHVYHVWCLLSYHKLPFCQRLPAATCRGSCRKSGILELLTPDSLMFEDSKIACF